MIVVGHCAVMAVIGGSGCRRSMRLALERLAADPGEFTVIGAPQRKGAGGGELLYS